jgi:hypothetical protein
MSLLESALELAAKGFHVFPLVPGTKIPIKDMSFPTMATRDEEQIRAWWQENPNYNIGISTSRFWDDEHLVVVDVDVKEGKRGAEEVLRLELEGFEFPTTAEQITASGGKHIIYRSQQPYTQGVSKLGKDIDIRAEGGFIVGAGSRVKGKTYALNWNEILPAPEWVLDRLSLANLPRQTIAAPLNINQNAASIRAREYLEASAPEAVLGQGSDQTTFVVACRVKDFGVDEETCFHLMMEHWYPRNPTPLSEEKVREKVGNAYRHGREPIGIASAEADFTPVPTEPTARELSYLEKMNAEYALIYIGGSHYILHETKDERGEPKRDLLSETSFRTRFKPFKVIDGDTKPKTQAEHWLSWPGRREFAGFCFAPGREPRNNYYNLWRGFTVEPLAPSLASPEQRRGLEMFLSHARENICQGDERLFKFLMGYFAHMIQKPYERPLTTLVLRGSKGVGKNALIDRVGKLIGTSHYLVAHDARYLTSNFNAHLDSCLMLVLDEAFWSGDKKAEGTLKGLTTAPQIMIERKGEEPYMVDNHVRLVVIGNEDWLVPASHDERRYAVFQVGSERKQDRNFFRQMRELLDIEGGSRCLLHYLQNFDLTTTDINAAPKTDALLDQKLSTLADFHQWWFQCLKEGVIVYSSFETWPDHDQGLLKSEFYSAFEMYFKKRNIRSRIPADNSVGRLFKQCLPSRKETKVNSRNGYKLPPLGQARQEFEEFIGHKVEWT